MSDTHKIILSIDGEEK